MVVYQKLGLGVPVLLCYRFHVGLRGEGVIIFQTTTSDGGGAASSLLSRSLVATNIGHSRDPSFLENALARLRALYAPPRTVRSVRMEGSCALAMSFVACGRLNAYYETGMGGPWDTCAGTYAASDFHHNGDLTTYEDPERT